LQTPYDVQQLKADNLLGYFLPESSNFVTLRRAFDTKNGQHILYVKESDDRYFKTSQYSLHQDLGRVYNVQPSTGECADLKYGRKDVSVNWQNPPRLNLLQMEWFYDWKTRYQPQYEKDPRYVRMIWCSGFDVKDIAGASFSLQAVAKADFDARLRGRIWLLLNEPDVKNQCGRTWLDKPKEAADYFIEASKRIKQGDPHAKIYAAGLVWLRTKVAKAWWTSFIDQLKAKGELQRLEGMHMHMYPFVSTSPTQGQYVGCDGSNAKVALASL
jgi:hypothetical protein